MKTDVSPLTKRLREITDEVRERNSLIALEEARIKKEERTNNLKAEVKIFFSHKVTEEKLILFAENGESQYPVCLAEGYSPIEGFYYKERLCEFGQLLWAEIESHGLKPVIIKICEQKRAKYFSTLNKGENFTTGYYLAITW